MKKLSYFLLLMFVTFSVSATIDCDSILSTSDVKSICKRETTIKDFNSKKKYICLQAFKEPKFYRIGLEIEDLTKETEVLTKSVSTGSFGVYRSLAKEKSTEYKELTGIGDEAFQHIQRGSIVINTRKGNILVEVKSSMSKKRGNACTEEQLTELAEHVLKSF